MALNNTQIFQISNKLFPRLHDIMSYFDIEYEEHPNRLSFACPIHGGDNPMGCSIFTDGNTSKGNWACWTQHCEEDYSKSLFGFVRGALANKLRTSQTRFFRISYYILTHIASDILRL